MEAEGERDTEEGETWGFVARFEAEPERFFEGISHLAALGIEPGPGERYVAISSAIGRLMSLPSPLVLSGLEELLVHARATLAMRWLERFGGLRLLLPEVACLIGFHIGSPKAHKDLWDHTLRVLERVAPEPDLRWIALAHDIGKFATRALLRDGTLAFHRHEAVGARLFIGIGARLGMAESRRDRIAFVIEHHGRTNQFEPSWTDRALRRLQRECGDHLPLMLAFSSADWTTKHRGKAARILENQAILSSRLERITQEDRAPQLPDGTSEALMQAMGRGPGPWLAEARRELRRRFDVAAMTPQDLVRAWLDIEGQTSTAH